MTGPGDIKGVFGEMEKACRKAAEALRSAKDVVVASHVDADGLTSSGIACTALDRLGLDYSPVFFKQLDSSALDAIEDMGADLVLFTDLGSGMAGEISARKIPAVIADHHRPAACEASGSISSGTISNGSVTRGLAAHGLIAHINPHLVGADGATSISGAGSAFLLARALGRNDDLARLAVVGAVGDLQDMAAGRLVGMNREILDIGSRAGVLSFGMDLKLFGRQTRPVYKMLEYSQDPYVPGLSGNEDACIAFLKEIGIRLGGERWRRWIDLDQEEKGRVVSALVRKGLRSGLSNVKLERLIGEVYTLLQEAEGTELRDASEFSTLLNATARYGHAGVGLAVCMGDREKAFEEARTLLNGHRQNLVNGLKLVQERGITQLQNIQYFDAGDAIRDTIVGIVAGMSFQMADRSKPILAFALTAEGEVKVSSRGTQDLVRSGLDLSAAMGKAAAAVGGVGGGHNVAAGATIPAGSREEFLGLVDGIVGGQMAGRAR